MHETPADLDTLRALLDRSYRSAGPHLASIHTPERRIDAPALAARLHGMRLLTVATVTADCRPITRPLDGLFYRGSFWFGTGTRSLTAAHLRARPALSATHVPGEDLGITVHGRALLDGEAGLRAGFAEYCVEVYGPGWEDWAAGALYARIAAERMFAFAL